MAPEVASVANAVAASSAGCSTRVGGLVPAEDVMMAEAVNVEVVGLFSYFPFFLSFFLSVPLFLLFLVVRWRLLLLLSVVFLLLVLFVSECF